MESNHIVESKHDLPNAPPELKTFKFSQPQRDHLQWLVEQCGVPVICKDWAEINANTKLIVVSKPPTGPQVEIFCRSLPMDAVVVIPFGENPVFDSLKSKLVNFGTIAPSGADGPHTFWWGGLSLTEFTTTAGAQRPLIISCFDPASNTADAARLVESLKALDLDHIVKPISDGPARGVTGMQKSQFILNTLETAGRPVLYVDPDATFRHPPTLLEKIECDVAIHKWRGWELSTRTLYFRHSEEAKALLQTWSMLLTSCPTVGEGYLLDQAWSLVSSQMPLRTFWLPRSYHSSIQDSETFDIAVIKHNLSANASELNPLKDFPGALQAARRAGRTGSPEAQLVLSSPPRNRDAVVVVLRDVQAMGASDVASTMRDIADAFSKDPGRFSQIELSLCLWEEDVKSAISAAEQTSSCVLVIEPTGYVWDKMFADLGRRISANPQKRRFRLPPRSMREIVHLH